MNSDLKPGTNLSHYRILSKLGGGGMGEVFLAEDTKLNRRVAIKLLAETAQADKQAHQRLIREARTAANLDHPNICSIHEIAEDGDQSFICMQYVEGETLDTLLKAAPPVVRMRLCPSAKSAPPVWVLPSISKLKGVAELDGD